MWVFSEHQPSPATVRLCSSGPLNRMHANRFLCEGGATIDAFLSWAMRGPCEAVIDALVLLDSPHASCRMGPGGRGYHPAGGVAREGQEGVCAVELLEALAVEWERVGGVAMGAGVLSLTRF
jgi:hypothetical protein